MIFVDTSALLAFLDVRDEHHAPAMAAFDEIVIDGRPMSHNYVVLESAALIHRRGGSRVVSRFMRDIVPLLELVWIDEPMHHRASREWLKGLNRRSSLVDHASFEVMRRHSVREAFAFDSDFAEAGFTVLP